MYQTLWHLAGRAEVHVVALLDHPDQIPANEALGEFCASTEFLVRLEGRTKYLGSILPHAVREFQHFPGHDVLDAVHARDPVTHRDDAADFGDVNVDGVGADLITDDFGYLFGFDVHCVILEEGGCGGRYEDAAHGHSLNRFRPLPIVYPPRF